jgi:ATP-dependent exoDNAse (exonuclease V) beta subunit
LRSPAGLYEEKLLAETREATLTASAGGLTRDLARAVGASLHRLLEHGALDEPDALDRAVQAVGRDEARARGLEERAVVSEVRDLVRRVADAPLRKWLAGLDVIGRELPVLFSDADGAVWHGVVDLIYREDGQPVVSDYKTEDPGSEPREAAERYRPQLDVYARGVQRALGLQALPAMEVIFLRTGDRVRLAGDSQEP